MEAYLVLEVWDGVTGAWATVDDASDDARGLQRLQTFASTLVPESGEHWRIREIKTIATSPDFPALLA